MTKGNRSLFPRSVRQGLLAILLGTITLAVQAADGSSAVAPIGGPSQQGPSAVLPGHFRHARRADAVVIHNNETKLCQAPDFQRCLPLGQTLPVFGTVATTVGGTSKLLVLDSMQSIRACDVEATGRGASLDCKAVDFNRLADYNLTTLAGGQLLAIDGTDGKYMCAAAIGGGARCLQVTEQDGTPIQKSPEQRRLESRLGVPFKPLDDQDRVCRLKSGAITCKPLKMSDLWDALKQPAVIEMDEITIIGQRLSDTAPGYVSTYAGIGDHRFMNDQVWAADPQTTPERPPTYWRDQCLAVCTRQDADYNDVCTITAGIIFAIFAGNPAITGGYYAACQAGRSYHSMTCRSICDGTF